MAEKKTTPEFKATFISMMEQLPNITAVSRLLDISPSNIWAARKQDPEFDAAISAAIEEGYDMLEEEARRRAVDGVVEPVYYKGEPVGGIRKYSDQLLVTLLKGYRPKKFNPGAKVTLDAGEEIKMTFNFGGSK